MGYKTKDIAIITEPKVVSLAAAPNFVTFASKAAVRTRYENNIQVNVKPVFNQYSFYRADGEREPIPPSIAGAEVWFTTDKINIAAYAGQAFTYNGSPVPLSYCVFFNAGGGVVSTFQVAFNGVTYSGTIPASATTVGLTNNADIFGAAAPSFIVGGVNIIPDPSVTSVLNITEPSGITHSFRGTTKKSEVTGSIFYVSEDTSDTAENLREVMLNSRWINANFEIRIPAEWSNSGVANGDTLNIKSKGAGSDFNIVVAAPANTGNVAYTITPVNLTSVNGDSISGEDVTAEIELDIYVDAALKLGQDDRAQTPDLLGELALTMQKSYAGVPLWFELNAVFSKYGGYNTPPATVGWFDTGTAKVFRFIARKKGINSFSFYQSSALFALNGYGYASENLDLDDYTYRDKAIKLLTNKPRTTYMRGQKEYLNFLAFHGEADPNSIGVIYRAYTTADVYIGQLVRHSKPFSAFSTVNTCVLDIDNLLDVYPKTGIVRVALFRDGSIISNDLEYLVRPQHLHELCQFTFLNRLGGWDAFNFDSTKRDEVKPEVETFSKTLTPSFKKGDSLETVYTSAISNSITIEGAPVSNEVADWLKELAAASVVLDAEGNYIIKEDFSIPIAQSTTNMQTPIIKYRLSETFTND